MIHHIIRPLIRAGLMVTLAIFLALLGAISWLAGTEAGLHLLLQEAVSQGVTIQKASGRLISGVDLVGLQLDLGNTTISAQHLHLRWRPWHLPLLGSLAIDTLKADKLIITTKPTPPTPEKPLPQIHLPFPVAIHHLEVKDLSYREAQQELFGAKRIWLAAQAHGSTITIQRLALEQPDHRAALSGTIRLQDAYPMQLELRAGLDHVPGTKPHTPPLIVQGAVHGDLQQLAVQLHSKTPQIVHVEARLSQLLHALQVDAMVRFAPADIAALFDGAPQGLYGGAIHLQGNLQDLHLNAHLAVSHSPLGHGAMLISARKSGNALRDIEADWHSTTGTLHARGTITSLDTQQATATLSWQGLHLPDAPEWRLDKGIMHLKGSAAGFDVQADSQATWIRPHQAPEVLAGHFNTHIAPQAIEITQASLRGFGAFLALQGRMSLQSTMQFALSGTLRDVDPGHFASQWPGRLETHWEAKGHLAPHWQVTASLDQLQGRLRDRPVRGHVQAMLSPNDYRLDSLELHSGQALLEARGQLNHELTLDLHLKAPQLDDLVPQTAGSLTIAANVAGPLTWPALRLEATGHKLRYQDWSLEALQGSGRLYPQDRGQGMLRLQATQLRSGTLQVSKFLMKLDGATSKHQLEIFADGPLYGLKHVHLAMSGGFWGKTWQGTIQDLDLRHEEIGHYALTRPAALSWSPTGRFALERMCLQQAPMMLCTQGAAQGAGQATLAITLHQVNLHRFEALLPTGYHLMGQLQGQADLRQEKGLWQGQGRLDLIAGQLTMEDDSAEGVPPITLLSMPSGNLQADLGRTWQFTSRLHLANQGLLQFQGQVKNPGSAEFATLPIRGSLLLQRLPLGYLGAAVPELAAVDMEANGRLDVTGTMSQPVLAGGFAIGQGRLELPALGLDVHDINLNVHTTQDNQLKLDAGLTSGKGRLRIAALGGVEKGHWRAQGTLQGHEVLLADIPQAHVEGSPNLALTMTPQRLHVAGTLALPKGKLQPALLPSGASVSTDEVIVGQQPKQYASSQEASIPLSARLRILAGPDLGIRAQGVQGKLEGDLTVVVEPRNPPIGVGEMRLVEGSYKAYGQDLQIGTGRVLFTGGPLSNPGLDLQATRAIEGGTVGLHVRGTVNQPELSFTSDPPLSESDTLSYLLFGRPLRQTSAEESNMVNQGMLNAGVRGGEFLAKMVGKRFGLSDVHVESTAGMPESAQLVVGRQLGPRLTVGYGVGIFDGLSTAHITYSLTPSLSLRTQAGSETAADLLYSLER